MLRSADSRRRAVLKLVRLVALLLVVVTAAGIVTQAIVSAREREAFPPPGRLVEVDGVALHIDCVGRGSPTVVLDAGGGDNLLTWSRVQPEIAASTRVCAYDRPGLGWSAEAAGTRDAQTAADRLHALLVAAGEPGPYVLVGHSAAGLTDRVFAARYPADVAGMVLVDPTPLVPAGDEAVLSILGSGMPLPLAFPASLTGLHRLVVWPGIVEHSLPTRRLPATAQDAYRATRYWSSALPTGAAEEAALPASIAQALGVSVPSDLPVTVLIAAIPVDQREALSAEVIGLLERAKQMQRAYVDGSASGDVQVVDGSSHFIQVDRPQVVIQAIERMVDGSQ